MCSSDLLLCSDGLTGMVSDEEITSALSSQRSLEEIVRGLIDLANERGGVDNITAIVVEVKPDRPAESATKPTDASREKTTVSLRVSTVSDEDVTPRDGVEIPVVETPAGEPAPEASETPAETPQESPQKPEPSETPEMQDGPPVKGPEGPTPPATG